MRRFFRILGACLGSLYVVSAPLALPFSIMMHDDPIWTVAKHASIFVFGISLLIPYRRVKYEHRLLWLGFFIAAEVGAFIVPEPEPVEKGGPIGLPDYIAIGSLLAVIAINNVIIVIDLLGCNRIQNSSG